MRTLLQFFVIAISVALCAPVAPAQEGQHDAQVAPDATIVIQPHQVRFMTQKAVEEMRLQIFDQNGQTVFDSGPVKSTEVDWPLEDASGEMLKSGLYAYTLSIREVAKEGDAQTRVRRGHLIVDRAKDRDGADKLWVTSKNESGVGTELTVAKDETATVAGAAIGERPDRPRGEVPVRQAQTETHDQSQANKGTVKDTATAVTVGTIGQIAKFTTTNDVGNSVISELNGNIGIGTANPTSKLEVTGTVDMKTGGSGGELYFHTPNSETGLSILGTSRADIRFDGNSLKLVAGPIGLIPPPTSGVVINTKGNVGIGAANILDAYKLNVGGSTILSPGGTGGDILIHTPGGETGMTIINPTSRADIRFGDNALKLVAGTAAGVPPPTNGVAITTSGRVGIGTFLPATKLHVESNGITEMTVKSFDERAIIALDNGLSHPLRYVWTLESGFGGTFTSKFGIYNRNVGKPGLTIDGSLLVSVSALEILAGADFAENFDVSAEKSALTSSASEIAPGMVVSIDPANPGKLSVSRRAYDRRVAGIISGAGGVKPGLTMGQEQTIANGKYPVALSGRVYVLVDATRSAVHPGDLLTTSGVPGHAMKAGNRARAQGAIIGKAMTGLNAGRGLVLVLVTLQ